MPPLCWFLIGLALFIVSAFQTIIKADVGSLHQIPSAGDRFSIMDRMCDE